MSKILGIIPARGGSKGVPRKNIRLLGGKPLISYTIELAHKSSIIDRLIVSTDDREIANVANSYGADVPFIRPVELANDTAKAISVVQHALQFCESQDCCKYDIIVYLEPPAPFRILEDIEIPLSKMKKDELIDSVIGVTEANHVHPLIIRKIEDNRLKPIWKDVPEGTPRQLYKPTAYKINGAIYAIRRRNVINGIFYGDYVVPHIMPADRSINIDDYLDWYAAEGKLISDKK
jgi:CMP-N,N'-diacetyllegionaminic acid synthase